MARPKPDDELVLCSIHLPQSLITELKRHCRETELTLTHVVKKAVREHLRVYPAQSGAAE